MAREVWRFPVTVPAGTLKANPQLTNLAMPAREVESIEIVVPPGPQGLVGFQLGSSGTQVIPSNAGQFFVTDREIIKWPLDGQINSGAWQLIAYNTGTFAHTIEVRFLVNLVTAPAPQVVLVPLPVGSISG